MRLAAPTDDEQDTGGQQPEHARFRNPEARDHYIIAIAARTGATTFRSSATAATATIVNTASLANGAYGSYTAFYATTRAGSANFDNRGSAFLGGPDPHPGVRELADVEPGGAISVAFEDGARGAAIAGLVKHDPPARRADDTRSAGPRGLAGGGIVEKIDASRPPADRAAFHAQRAAGRIRIAGKTHLPAFRARRGAAAIRDRCRARSRSPGILV